MFRFASLPSSRSLGQIKETARIDGKVKVCVREVDLSVDEGLLVDGKPAEDQGKLWDSIKEGQRREAKEFWNSLIPGPGPRSKVNTSLTTTPKPAVVVAKPVVPASPRSIAVALPISRNYPRLEMAMRLIPSWARRRY